MLTIKEAAKKLTKSEYALFLSSEARHLEKMTKRQIDLKLKRLLKEIDKLKGEKLKVKRTLKSAGLEAEKMLKSKTKLKYFNEAFKRFKTQLLKATKTTTTKKVAKKSVTKKKASKKVAPKKRVGLTKNIPTKKRSLKKSGVILKQAHASSRNKRFQGKKDSR